MAKKTKSELAGSDGIICRNSRVIARYEIEDTLEVGIVLSGSEVKSLRQRRADLEAAFASIQNEELWLHRAHIATYDQGGPHFNHEPKRSRKLLAHRHEILRLVGRISTQGYTLVPIDLHFKNGKAKALLGLGKGKKSHDDREAIRRKVDLREARAEMKDR